MADEESLSLLLSMGFKEEDAKAALDRSGGSAEAATNFLLNSAPAYPETSSSEAYSIGGGGSSSSVISTVHCPMSQFDVPGGKSACTCISLCAALQLLLEPQAPSTNMLQQAMIDGGERYNEMLKSSPDTSIEHLSPEEVLRNNSFSQLLKMIGGTVRQGMLSRDATHPLGMTMLLSGCQDSTKWVCVVVTKPPETVLVCLPPNDNGNTTSKREEHVFSLVDSHPRPHLFGGGGAYARIHSDFHGLIQSLNQVFPYTELCADIPELMAAMYNSFDLYPLELL